MRPYSTNPGEAAIEPKCALDLTYQPHPDPEKTGHKTFARDRHKHELAALRRRHKKRARRAGALDIQESLQGEHKSKEPNPEP